MDHDHFDQEVEKILADLSTKLQGPKGVILVGDDKSFSFQLPGGLSQALGAVTFALAESDAAFAFFAAAVKGAKAFRRLRRKA